MRALSAAELLDIWEWGATHSRLEAALQLVRAAYPGLSLGDVAGLGIGQFDVYLLAIREWLFGPSMSLLADCEACGQRIEVSFDVSDVREEAAGDPRAERNLELGPWRVEFRLPTCEDVLALPRHTTAEEGRQILLGRCVTSITEHGRSRSADQLSEDVVAAISDRMASADPQANLRLPICCPQCELQWQSPFDIIAFLWAEISTWAQRVLMEVRALAARYHWSERDILAMTPRRRQFYLSGVGI